MPWVSEPVGSLGKVSEQCIDMGRVINHRVFLLVTEESLELLEGHVLHVLTVGIELLSNLRGRRREEKKERRMT